MQGQNVYEAVEDAIYFFKEEQYKVLSGDVICTICRYSNDEAFQTLLPELLKSNFETTDQHCILFVKTT